MAVGDRRHPSPVLEPGHLDRLAPRGCDERFARPDRNGWLLVARGSRTVSIAALDEWVCDFDVDAGADPHSGAGSIRSHAALRLAALPACHRPGHDAQ